MRRYKLTIKGSAEELKWLNRLAQRGWLLSGVHGNWYQFKRTDQRYRLFSEYLTDDVAADVQNQRGPFDVLTITKLRKPAVQVLYSATNRPELAKARIDAGDAPTQLKIALAMRAHLLNLMNAFFIGGVVLFFALILTNHMSNAATDWYVVVWLIISFTPAVMASRVHKRSNALRVRTQDYSGAWKPTEHVFLKNMTGDLDLDQVKELGDWNLVGHDKKGTYWYDVQSLASIAEIKQTLQPIVGPNVQIAIMSNLGLAPIGYI